VAGASGGAAEAVVHGETGLVVSKPDDVDAVADAIDQLLDDPERRGAMGAAARRRAEDGFTYDHLAARLGAALAEWEAGDRG
jgi:phosphatidylinositol alpha-1,6-mannosyltransferase